MRASEDDEPTPFGVTKTAHCTGCGTADSEYFVYPTTNIGRILCLNCVRGANIAAAREALRQRKHG